MTSPASADINGDGKADLLAIRKSDGNLARFNGTGTGGFTYAGNIGSGWENYDQLAASPDLNGDGKADLLAIRKSDGNLARFNGTGTGGFTYAGNIGSGWENYNNLTATGDLNGDGKADLLAIRKSDGNLARFNGTGTGGFTYAGNIGSGWENYNNLTATGDLNGDGKADLVAIRKSDGNLARFNGTGTGGFTYAGNIGSGWENYDQLAAGSDLNGDGKRDLLAIRKSDGNLARFNGTGTGGFTYAGNIGSGWENYDNLVLTPSASGGSTPPGNPPGTPPTDPRHNMVLTLTSVANGRFVTAELPYPGADKGMLRTRSDVVGEWQIFRLISAGDGTYGIRSEANGLYVSAEMDYAGADHGMLRARHTAIESWERFSVEVHSDGSWSLRSAANGRYVSTELDYTGDDKGMLRARATGIGTWEKFRVNQRHRDDSLDKPIYLVHGYDPDGLEPTHDCRSYWNTTINDYRYGDAPNATGPIHTIGYYGANTSCDIMIERGGRGTGLQHLGNKLAWEIYNRYSSRGISVDVVAHSMGGLILRAALTGAQQKLGNWPPYLYIEDAITLSTPHGGSDWALACTTAQCRDMTPGSAFLVWLDDNPQGDQRTDWTLMSADDDDSVKAISGVNMPAPHKIRYPKPQPPGTPGIEHNAFMTLLNGHSYRYKVCEYTPACADLSQWTPPVSVITSTMGSPVYLSRKAAFHHSTD
ncbi:FG-GAP-like repeat-containing protein [Rhizohabitans arisaemae]|uniref:FG-GAP-like repeat-containing protein n=1 Tax=Rhizohabitans arisaemae TaxID=2720610 RepID=UPI0024B149F4|nr:FG-GAP-like repeat-containing protein [Rhizohabitans arisaemae]